MFVNAGNFNDEEIDLDNLNSNDSGVDIDIDDIDNFKRLTDKKVIEIASGDIVAHIKDYEKTLEALGNKPGSYYRDIIFALVHIRLPEDEAKRDWEEILKHKYTTSQSLDRNVGMHVATLDYYTNIKRKMFTPKIMDANDWVDTATMAITDELTRAYNRGFFDDESRRHFQQARATGKTFSLIMLDLDHFKKYNDINGHIRGDIALIETVRILHAVCSADDVVSRYGGEEFLVLLPDQELDAAMQKAENIRQAVFEYRFINEQELPSGRLSCSLGLTTYRATMKTPSEMLAEADIALYLAKNSGRNCVKAFVREETA
jgi:diguanylate cyclase (GGDEF)-like protein